MSTSTYIISSVHMLSNDVFEAQNFYNQVRKCHRNREIFLWISICKYWHVRHDSRHYVITFFNIGISDLSDCSCENAQFTLERTIGTIYQ